MTRVQKALGVIQSIMEDACDNKETRSVLRQIKIIRKELGEK